MTRQSNTPYYEVAQGHINMVLSRILTNQDDAASRSETGSIMTTFYLNLVIFICLMLLFECNRHLKSVYVKRYSEKFKKAKRVPELPPKYPFGWIFSILKVSDDDFLRMVGLDAYVFIRFIKLCLK